MVSIHTTEYWSSNHFFIVLNSDMLCTIILSIFFTEPKIYKIDLPSILFELFFLHHEITRFDVSVEIACLMESSDAVEGIVHDEKKYVFFNFILHVQIDQILLISHRTCKVISSLSITIYEKWSYYLY